MTCLFFYFIWVMRINFGLTRQCKISVMRSLDLNRFHRFIVSFHAAHNRPSSSALLSCGVLFLVAWNCFKLGVSRAYEPPNSLTTLIVHELHWTFLIFAHSTWFAPLKAHQETSNNFQRLLRAHLIRPKTKTAFSVWHNLITLKKPNLLILISASYLKFW